MSSQRSIRPAKKAGSWYTKEANELTQEFETWLDNSKKSIPNKQVKAIICPHAGYMYCGQTAAYSYHHVDPTQIERVFILGPDHCGATHSAKHNCMLSGATHWQTPFGNISVDTDIISQLYQTKCFDMLTMDQDSAEHSMELIVPFLSFMFYSYYNSDSGNASEETKDNDKTNMEWNKSFTIVPIMVGNCKEKHHKLYGKILSEYFADPKTFFVISSDFCHWGNNYGYMPFDKNNYGKGCIHEYIRDLDFMGIALLEKLDYGSFYKYLNKTQNTICGQHPICVLLNMIECCSEEKYEMKFVNYSQSSKVKSVNDYSVSYASGILYKVEDEDDNGDKTAKNDK